MLICEGRRGGEMGEGEVEGRWEREVWKGEKEREGGYVRGNG